MEEQENEKNNLVNDRRSYSSRLGSTSYGSDSYEELLRGSVPCPTCRGKGNIPKGCQLVVTVIQNVIISISHCNIHIKLYNKIIS